MVSHGFPMVFLWFSAFQNSKFAHTNHSPQWPSLDRTQKMWFTVRRNHEGGDDDRDGDRDGDDGDDRDDGDDDGDRDDGDDGGDDDDDDGSY